MVSGVKFSIPQYNIKGRGVYKHKGLFINCVDKQGGIGAKHISTILHKQLICHRSQGILIKKSSKSHQLILWTALKERSEKCYFQMTKFATTRYILDSWSFQIIMNLVKIWAFFFHWFFFQGSRNQYLEEVDANLDKKAFMKAKNLHHFAICLQTSSR